MGTKLFKLVVINGNGFSNKYKLSMIIFFIYFVIENIFKYFIRNKYTISLLKKKKNRVLRIDKLN